MNNPEPVLERIAESLASIAESLEQLVKQKRHYGHQALTEPDGSLYCISCGEAIAQ